MALSDHTAEEIAAAIREAEHITGAARALHCGHETLAHAVESDPLLRRAYEEVKARWGALRAAQDPVRTAEAIREAQGVVVRAARLLGCSANHVYQLRQRHPEVRRALDEARAARARQCHPEFEPARVAEAFRQGATLMREAARLAGCSEQTVGRYVSLYAEVRQAYEEARARRPPTARLAYDPARVAAALHEAGGSVAGAAALAGCSRCTVENYVARCPEVRQALEEERARPPWRDGGRYDPAAMIEALHRARGEIDPAARRLKCVPNTIRRYIARCPEVRQAYEEEQALALARGNSGLAERVDAGDWDAICQVLRNWDPERRYSAGGRAAGVRKKEAAIEEFKAVLEEVLLRRSESANSETAGRKRMETARDGTEEQV